MPAPDHTVARSWESFAAHVLRPHGVGPGSAQWSEMRKAFYAGTFACLAFCRDVPGDAGVSEEEGVAMLQALLDECLAFQRDVVAGRA